MAAVVGHGGLGFVERYAVDGLRVVAHCAVDRLHRPLGEFASTGYSAIAVELSALGLNGGDVAVLAQYLYRGLEEVDIKLVRGIARLAHGVGLQRLAHQVGGLGGAAGLYRSLVILDVLRVDDDLDGRGLVQLLKLLWRVLSLRRAAAAEDVDLLGAVLLKRCVHVIRDLSNQQLICGLGQDAGDVEGDIAHADDGNGFCREIPIALEVGVAVIKAHEFAGAMVALEVLARDTHALIGGSTGGEDDGVIILAHLLDGDVLAYLDIAQEADLFLFHNVVQGLHNALNARVIRCHAVADQSKRRRHLFKKIDLHIEVGFH